MNEILILSEDVANMVAAGEVVERPFNVVKELMENSADAGATRISVVVENGGVGMVRVTDNGRGILPDDLPAALQRFATSKIKNADDVYNVKTFGFRGEALAAISSVSDFSIRSCRKDYDGAEIRIKHGGTPSGVPAPAIEGTTVEVRSLFANVPARLKFFKSFSAEEREIAKFVRFFSVINPNIAIELSINGKNTYTATAGMDMTARAVQVTREKDLVYGESEYEGMKLSFVTSLATVQRYRKDMIIVGVNGRVVKDPSIVQAVVTAYHRMIPDGKFPACAVSLHVDPDKVDVNVHPAKTTVKLLDARDIFSFVHHNIKNRLDDAGHDQGVQMRTPDSTEHITSNSYSRPEPDTKYDHQFATQSYDIASEMEVVEYEHRSSAEIVHIPEQSGAESAVRVVGQLFNTVIVCEKDGEALFIDQHVAHERVLYEKFIREAAMTVPSVVMYEPLLINVGEDELAVAEDSKDVFDKFGYEIESFGGESLKVSRVPTDVLNRDIEAQVKGILADMLEERKDTSVDYRALVMSCKAAVKAGDKLEMHEMRRLVSDLFTTDNPYTCPHGRPIVFKQPEEFFLRKFGR
ncbi:DNA mismatch repair protein MutL [Denitrovibrio acetiphilus DSM 12809]|uniref:DNA mismatch repair protein MutL n=1 Tax=Denitrovibrio acetiphilus (strain DSM 12809 / NBRC 114555 / N2460) TaxID=522772 RepID=D4H0L8_DENA2|nr:DNA mismatch repair endonuclease MutL [Denitrovibrio acetiphilus]ADD68531.1 DNA mismatch repair protein MutL [Denitrovibrio acetiphilus DSM 12809]